VRELEALEVLEGLAWQSEHPTIGQAASPIIVDVLAPSL
jgi:hypothetical protein